MKEYGKRRKWEDLKEKKEGGERRRRRGGVKERRGVGMRRKGGFFRFPPLSSKPFYILVSVLQITAERTEGSVEGTKDL